ncbi:LysR family transcriptional regulator [Paenibacillus sp. NEAU-GSW1]|uniref:LysR family transcriptional regulator n=1 Tax=Paenibacillus sp. NEAU-GSW1 TaxID=2682486 RepID=UPI0012E1511B|nr:LysR family transcriptional regulator [Paenibacillus sp. NEAU-GSW1]MUT64617.1 LysR family transcriptional regulator [Paenibacillus sp. NEAU-GSW1]
MNVNLEWYRVFYWIAKSGSLTAAAAKLHITQPAVSHTVKQLEEQLGGALFFRTSKGVQLTAEGEVLLRYVEKAFISVNMGEKAIAEMHNLDSGDIRIGASDTLCKHYLLPYLESFHEQYPNIRIHVTNRTTPETLALLKEGKIDFGIVSAAPSGIAPGLAAEKGIEIRKNAVIRDCLVGGKGYFHLADAPLPLNALSDYPSLLLESGSMRSAIDEYAAANGLAITPEFELGSIDLLVQFALRGFGLAFVIRNFVEAELQSGELAEIPLDPPLPERHIGIATLQGIPMSAASKRFLSLLP